MDVQRRRQRSQRYINGGSIVGPTTAIAYVEGDISLQCTYLDEQYFPYDKFWLHWEFPVTVTKNTHQEHLQVVKLNSYVLLINTLTMNNISTIDEGNYNCLMNNLVYFDTVSKYIYVNDKKTNYSAPWIYYPNGGEIQVNSGANVTLRCAGSRPVTWGRPIIWPWLGRKFYKVKHVSNLSGLFETYLHLTEVNYTDIGPYNCHEKGSVVDHPFKSDKIYIFVKDEENSYIPYENTKSTYPYTNVTVPCLATSRDVNVSLSMLHYTFDPDTRNISTRQIIPVIYAYDNRKGFTVQMPDPDAATAKCTFATETAINTLDINYNIKGYESKPLITGPDGDLVFVGQTLQLSCTVLVYYNVPDDALRWTSPNHFTSSEVIEDVSKINFRQGKVLINKLTLHDVKDANAGRYLCNLSSHNATANKVISVYDTFTVIKPVIQNLTYDYAYIGQPLILRCKVDVDHNVAFQMSWTTPNDTEIQNLDIEYTRNVRNISGEIIFKIDNTTQENEGNYTCNVFYSTNKRNYTIKHILVKSGKNPRIITNNFKEQEEILVVVEETVNLTCSAEGVPKPVITWMKDSTQVRTLGQHISFAADNSELTVHNVQRFDAGLYTCIAQNPFGRDSRAVNLRFQTVSFIPFYVAVFFMITLITIVSVLLGRRICKQKKLRKELNEVGFIKFKSGEFHHLKPYVNKIEQAALLFYNTKWEIPRNSIELGRNLGSGYFGLVVEATVSNFFDREPEKTVAVKMLHRNCNTIELNSFICELKIMTHVGKHVNLINLLGACTDRIAEGNLLIVIEYCEHGSLSNYLRENRCNFVNLIDPDTELICFLDNDNDSLEGAAYCGSSGVSTLKLLRWALQVARGMKFLASKHILHGDLAVRNLLLDENYVVKISDFGLSKTLSSSAYYKKTSECPLPIKWMAIESIRDKTFSTQSDVWSFGVVLWELFSLARTPYAELEPDFRFYRKLASGYRLERPEYSTKEIYQIMRECWCEQPKRRPTFSCLVRTLCDLLQDPNEHCNTLKEEANDEVASCGTHSIATSVLSVSMSQNNLSAAPNWIALDILPQSPSDENVTAQL